MITIEESLAIISTIPPLNRAETVSLNTSYGRVLAQDIVADTDLPPFNKSAMDGYACRQEDLPGPLTVSGYIAAGDYNNSVLLPGHCYRIFTGAPVPDGANCVLMQEQTTEDSQGNILFTQKETKKNICYRGEDMKTGEIALKAGTVLLAQHIATMAGFGVNAPLVSARPRVAIICSGSELVEPPQKPNKAQIRNSNAYQLISQVSATGAEADYLGIVTDSKNILAQQISNTIGKYNVVIVTGGASVGDYDFMPSVLESLSATIHFSALNIQPGKPVLFATIGSTHILGLSGNPVSSFLQFLLVAKPLLLRLQGSQGPFLKIAKAPLSETIKRKKSNRQLYIPVAFTPSGLVQPIPFNGSAHITALSNMDGFAIIDPDMHEMTESQLVNLLIL